ncbi:MAG: hypothetical protein M3445_03560 [Actinomycetota bacterium]|nr:hypothetical protein [Actinomycetota bacterium]
MSEPTGPRSGETTGAPRSGPLSRWVVAAPAIALLVGLVLGGLVVGVASTESDSDSADDTVPSPSASTSAPGTSVVVPDSCLQSAETVAEATALIRNGVGAIRDFRPEEILDLLDELEDLDAQAREQAAMCADVEIADVPLPSGSTAVPSSPTASPTAS